MDLHVVGLYVEYVWQGLCGECGSVCRVRDIQSNAVARIHCRQRFGRQVAGTVRHEDKRITVAIVQLPFYFGIRQELSSLYVVKEETALLNEALVELSERIDTRPCEYDRLGVRYFAVVFYFGLACGKDCEYKQ